MPINGQKKWIGNSPWCDISIIWARDLADNQVKAFIVENKTTPGFKVEKIQNKIALKVVQNGEITMKDRVCTHFGPHVIALIPPLPIAAPAYPPMSACDELLGMP